MIQVPFRSTDRLVTFYDANIVFAVFFLYYELFKTLKVCVVMVIVDDYIKIGLQKYIRNIRIFFHN